MATCRPRALHNRLKRELIFRHLHTSIPAVAECLCSNTQTGQAAQALMHVRTESVRQSLVSRQLGCKHVILARISSSTIGYFGTHAAVYHNNYSLLFLQEQIKGIIITVTVRTDRGEVPVDTGIFVMVSVIEGRVFSNPKKCLKGRGVDFNVTNCDILV